MNSVKDDIAMLKEFLATFLKLKKGSSSSECPVYEDIRVLEELSDSEQESLADRVVPPASRAKEICSRLNIDNSKYIAVMERFLERLPTAPTERSTVYSTNDGPMFEIIAKLLDAESRKKSL